MVRGGGVRKRTVRSGLRFMIAAVVLLLLGTFYGQQVNAVLSLPTDGAFEFVRLAFFWAGIFGASGVIICIAGLVQRSPGIEKFRLMPSFFLFVLLLVVFFTLFYRTLTAPPADRPLRPGETLII